MRATPRAAGCGQRRTEVNTLSALIAWVRGLMSRALKRRAAMSSQTSFADTTPPTVPGSPSASSTTGSGTSTLQDDANRANGGIGANWTSNTGSDVFNIASNEFKSNSTNYVDARYTGSTPANANYSAEITVKTLGPHTPLWRVSVRDSGSGAASRNAYSVILNPSTGQYSLQKVVSGSDVEKIAPTSFAMASGDRLGIRATGTSSPVLVEILKNGAVIDSWSDSSSPYTSTGVASMGLYNPEQDATFDDFTVTTAVSSIAQITVTATASTDNVGVVGYELSRRVDTGGGYGGWSIIAPSLGSPSYNDTAIYTGTFQYRWRAYDAAGNYSGYSSSTSGVTIGSGSADVTAPSVPGQARVDSGSGDDLEAMISWPLSTDSGSGVKEYDVLVDGVVVGTVPHPRISASSTFGSIGAESPSGSHGAGTITGGGPQHWGVLDAFSFDRYTVDGDYDAYVTFLTVTRSGPDWGKGLLEDRLGVDPASQYYAGVRFDPDDSDNFKVEYRTGSGVQAAGSAESGDPLPLRVWLYSRHKVKTVKVSTVLTLGAESWQQRDSREVDVPQSRLVGLAASNATVTFENFSVAPATRASYKLNGVASTTPSVTIKARDFAGNTSAASTGLTVTFNAPSGGGGGGGGGGGSASHDYPRRGAYVTGGGTGGDQTYSLAADRERIADNDVIILGGDQAGFFSGAALTRQQTYSDIAARAIAKGRTLYKYQYVNYNEMDFNRAGSMMGSAWWDAVNGSNWWGYVNGTSGEKCGSLWSRALGLINPSRFCPTKDGLYPYQWAGYHTKLKFLDGIEGAFDVAPALEGFFLDNLFWYPKTTSSNFDVGRGSAATLNDWWDGHRDFLDACKLYTGRRAGGNTSDLFSGSFVTYPRTQLLGVCDIGILEGYLTGAGNLATCIPTINDHASRLSSDGHLIVEHWGLNANGSDAFDSTPFRASRYHKCMMLMTKGYYEDGWNDYHWGDANTMKVFDEDRGGALDTPNFLGAAIDGPQSAPWSGPVWRREFQYGWVYATDTAATVSLTGLHRMTSTRGDPINNGASGGSVNLANRDGIIVLK